WRRSSSSTTMRTAAPMAWRLRSLVARQARSHPPRSIVT
ncbi:MAG: hypothetical protein AVDCRST_MAG71-2230, partial [uncultured Lysobacter sp.]